ncbi:ABC transporter [Bradyrhizobium japonicum]|nr:ABC transporter [Bradyrhizobium japonicum]
MAGLDPAIHVFPHGAKNVDARVKPGHDDLPWIAQLRMR